ncbi:hypothetical protein AB0230_07095 [Microbacterium sp. NPDC089190]|uniref:hypothetical protein n=1 Tax=Microbacterium sp. NPDC089190 TaxID=3155063 RepID=UPI003450E2BD
MEKPDADFRASAGSIAYTGGRFDYEPGWYVQEVEGLTDGASTSSEEVPRDQGEGQHDIPNRLDDARSIRLSGFAYAQSLGDLGRMAREHGALLAMPEQSGAFTWLEFGDWFTTDVRRGSNWRFMRDGDTGFASFTHRFRAPSQVYFGVEPERASGTDVYVTNRGTIPSAPVITVTGNMPGGYTIYGPDERVYQITAGLAPGQVDVIDMSVGALYRDGVILTGGVYGSRVDVWTIAAGERQNQALLPAAGAGSMTVELFPAFF